MSPRLAAFKSGRELRLVRAQCRVPTSLFPEPTVSRAQQEPLGIPPGCGKGGAQVHSAPSERGRGVSSLGEHHAEWTGAVGSIHVCAWPGTRLTSCAGWCGIGAVWRNIGGSALSVQCLGSLVTIKFCSAVFLAAACPAKASTGNARSAATSGIASQAQA